MRVCLFAHEFAHEQGLTLNPFNTLWQVISFGMGTHGYKDGQGNDRYDNTAMDEFWSDFKTMETYYRKPGPAALLAETAARIGGPNISCRSNFNKTRAAGEMHQHTWALAMMVAIRTLEETDQGDHSFKVRNPLLLF